MTLNELERYVDILFADYLQYDEAQQLRIKMLNELLLQKESLQVAGRSESEAIRDVLVSLDDFGAPAEGNRLIFGNRFRRATAQSLLLWLIAGFVLSVPLLVFGNWIASSIMLAAVLYATVRFFRVVAAEDSQVEFCSECLPARLGGKLWLAWVLFAVLWTIVMAFLGDQQAVGFYAEVEQALRFYPPVILLVVPFYGSGLIHLLRKSEIGYCEEEAL